MHNSGVILILISILTPEYVCGPLIAAVLPDTWVVLPRRTVGMSIYHHHHCPAIWWMRIVCGNPLRDPPLDANNAHDWPATAVSMQESTNEIAGNVSTIMSECLKMFVHVVLLGYLF